MHTESYSNIHGIVKCKLVFYLYASNRSSAAQKIKSNALHFFLPDFKLSALTSLPLSKEITTQAYIGYPFIRKYLMKLQKKTKQTNKQTKP